MSPFKLEAGTVSKRIDNLYTRHTMGADLEHNWRRVNLPGSPEINMSSGCPTDTNSMLLLVAVFPLTICTPPPPPHPPLPLSMSHSLGRRTGRTFTLYKENKINAVCKGNDKKSNATGGSSKCFFSLLSPK